MASEQTLVILAEALIFPHEMASSGDAPASDPSNSCPVLMYTEKSAPFRMRFALAMWCFTTPPPRMIMPVHGAPMAIRLTRRMSCTRSITKPGFLYEWKKIMSPSEPSVSAGQKIGMLFFAAQ